ncbi:hypothetical protein EK21DRAFT_77658, partial [Setomelanomma holmii]
RACEVEAIAFASNALSPLLFPGPMPSDSRHQRILQLVELKKTDPSVRFMHAHDEETKQLVAFAKWHVYDTPEAAAKSDRPMRSFGPGTNREACEAFFGGLSIKKKEHIGHKPHLYLHMLNTDPAFQRRGAGGKLVESGTKMADELGLIAYLESSEAGYGLYKRHGFKEFDAFNLDHSKYGASGIDHTALMIREPTKAEWTRSGPFFTLLPTL